MPKQSVMPSSQKNNRTSAITIDGPAGAGKSTVAKALAKKLSFFYLDTGAMYRALTLKAMRAGLDLNDEESLVALAKETAFDFKGTAAAPVITLDGKDVGDDIRTPEVTNNTYYIARIPALRAVVVEAQQQIGQMRDIVIEGRDTGTVVFPEADVKFFLDAKLEARSHRRAKDLKEAGRSVDIKNLKNEIQQRDHSDQTRDTGALKKADDAIYIDSTDLTPEQTVEVMLKHIKNC